LPAGWLSLRQLLRHYAISSVLLFSLRHIFAIAAFRHAISTMRDVACLAILRRHFHAADFAIDAAAILPPICCCHYFIIIFFAAAAAIADACQRFSPIIPSHHHSTHFQDASMPSISAIRFRHCHALLITLISRHLRCHMPMLPRCACLRY
jgi:hypothetical protein